MHYFFFSLSNVVRVQDTLASIDIPDVTALELLQSFQVTPSLENSDELDDNDVHIALPRNTTTTTTTINKDKDSNKMDEDFNKQQLNDNNSGDSSNNNHGNDSNNSDWFPKFSFATGDFVEVYTNLKSRNRIDDNPAFDAGANSWDAVVTCFFVDTAPVVLE